MKYFVSLFDPSAQNSAELHHIPKTKNNLRICPDKAGKPETSQQALLPEL